MRDANRGVGLVDVLTTGARGAEGVDAQLRRIELDGLDLVQLRQDRDRHRRRMNTSLRFGGRHALHAMGARFEFQLRERAATDDATDDFFVAAMLAGVFRQHFDVPAMLAGVARIHPEQIAREDRRLVAAGAGAHFEINVTFVALVFGDELLRELVLFDARCVR